VNIFLIRVIFEGASDVQRKSWLPIRKYLLINLFFELQYFSIFKLSLFKQAAFSLFFLSCKTGCHCFQSNLYFPSVLTSLLFFLIRFFISLVYIKPRFPINKQFSIDSSWYRRSSMRFLLISLISSLLKNFCLRINSSQRTWLARSFAFGCNKKHQSCLRAKVAASF